MMIEFRWICATALLLLLLANCNSGVAQDALPGDRSFINYDLLRQLCRGRRITDQCPADAIFCSNGLDCPVNFECSCNTENCGELTCKVNSQLKVCTGHPQPRFGFTIRRPNMVEFACDVGYMLDGPREKMCSNGQWIPPEFPRCVQTFCDNHTIVSNGDVTYRPEPSGGELYRFNSIASIRCDDGYTRVGPADRTCQSNGEWSGNLPVCKRDGQWTPFTDWSPCDVTCGRGLQHRNRTCIEPEEGGQPCPEGDVRETRVCNTQRACQSVATLGCFTQAPWDPSGRVLEIDFVHPQLSGKERCLHRCKRHRTNYAALRGLQRCWCFDRYRLDGVVPGCSSSSADLYKMYPVPQGAECYRQVRDILVENIPNIYYTRVRFTKSCGWWGISRCTDYRLETRTRTVQRYRSATRITKC